MTSTFEFHGEAQFFPKNAFYLKNTNNSHCEIALKASATSCCMMTARHYGTTGHDEKPPHAEEEEKCSNKSNRSIELSFPCSMPCAFKAQCDKDGASCNNNAAPDKAMNTIHPVLWGTPMRIETNMYFFVHNNQSISASCAQRGVTQPRKNTLADLWKMW